MNSTLLLLGELVLDKQPVPWMLDYNPRTYCSQLVWFPASGRCGVLQYVCMLSFHQQQFTEHLLCAPIMLGARDITIDKTTEGLLLLEFICWGGRQIRKQVFATQTDMWTIAYPSFTVYYPRDLGQVTPLLYTSVFSSVKCSYHRGYLRS